MKDCFQRYYDKTKNVRRAKKDVFLNLRGLKYKLKVKGLLKVIVRFDHKNAFWN